MATPLTYFLHSGEIITVIIVNYFSAPVLPVSGALNYAIEGDCIIQGGRWRRVNHADAVVNRKTTTETRFITSLYIATDRKDNVVSFITSDHIIDAQQPSSFEKSTHQTLPNFASE